MIMCMVLFSPPVKVFLRGHLSEVLRTTTREVSTLQTQAISTIYIHTHMYYASSLALSTLFYTVCSCIFLQIICKFLSSMRIFCCGSIVSNKGPFIPDFYRQSHVHIYTVHLSYPPLHPVTTCLCLQMIKAYIMCDAGLHNV